MNLKKQIRTQMPKWSMNLFRLSRSLYRTVFRLHINRKRRNEYIKLILNKFPDLTEWEDKGYVLDLGANLGHFTDAVLHLGFKVIAVEPHPEAFRYLQKRFGRDSKVTLINRAVSENSLAITLQLHPDHKNDPLTTSLSASTIAEKFSQSHDSVEVRTIKFSDLMNMASIFSIVKIDIEGAEIDLFEDIVIQEKKIRNLLMETHTRFMSSEKYKDKYEMGLKLLNEFISENNLERQWYTDWV
jgi:FkbM family methyltransferase